MTAMRRTYSGLRHLYFVDHALDIEWHSRWVAWALSASPEAAYRDFQYSLRSSPDSVMRTSDSVAFRTEVAASWNDVSWSSLWLDANGFIISSRCDHERQLLELEFRGDESIDAAQLHEKSRAVLEISRTQGHLFRYRRSSATYQVGSWSIKSFADALETVVRQFGRGTTPAVGEAYVSHLRPDEVERLTPFATPQELIDYLRADGREHPEFVGLSIEGAEGTGFGIFLSAKRTRLEFKTQLPPEQIVELVHPFLKPLQLKPTKNASAGSGLSDAGSQRQEPWWIKHAVAIGLGILGVTSVSGAVAVYRMLNPAYELRITEPSTQDSVSVGPSDSISVRWYLRPTTMTFRGTQHDALADIRVLHNGALLSQLSHAAPGAWVPITAGRLEIIVTSIAAATEPRAIIVNVASDRAPKQSRP